MPTAISSKKLLDSLSLSNKKVYDTYGALSGQKVIDINPFESSQKVNNSNRFYWGQKVNETDLSVDDSHWLTCCLDKSCLAEVDISTNIEAVQADIRKYKIRNKNMS